MLIQFEHARKPPPCTPSLSCKHLKAFEAEIVFNLCANIVAIYVTSAEEEELRILVVGLLCCLHFSWMSFALGKLSFWQSRNHEGKSVKAYAERTLSFPQAYFAI